MTPGEKLRQISSSGGGRVPVFERLYEEERKLWEAAGKYVETLEAQGGELQGQIEALRKGSLREVVEVVNNSKWDDCEMEIDKDVQLILSGVAKKKQWRWSLIALRRDYSSVDLAWGECGKVRDLNAARAVAERGARAYLETLLSILDDKR